MEGIGFGRIFPYKIRDCGNVALILGYRISGTGKSFSSDSFILQGFDDGTRYFSGQGNEISSLIYREMKKVLNLAKFTISDKNLYRN